MSDMQWRYEQEIAQLRLEKEEAERDAKSNLIMRDKFRDLLDMTRNQLTKRDATIEELERSAAHVWDSLNEAIRQRDAMIEEIRNECQEWNPEHNLLAEHILALLDKEQT